VRNIIEILLVQLLLLARPTYICNYAY